MEDDLEKERGDGGTYVGGKRRGAVPAGLARSGGRQTQLRQNIYLLVFGHTKSDVFATVPVGQNTKDSYTHSQHHPLHSSSRIVRSVTAVDVYVSAAISLRAR